MVEWTSVYVIDDLEALFRSIRMENGKCLGENGKNNRVV